MTVMQCIACYAAEHVYITLKDAGEIIDQVPDVPVLSDGDSIPDTEVLMREEFEHTDLVCEKLCILL